MDYDQFLEVVQQTTDSDRDTARRAAQATLHTLSERISDGQALQLGAQLPPELRSTLVPTGAAERFDFDEFLRRVAEREGVDVETAERHARAVLTAVGQAVSKKELDDLAAELPKDFWPILPRGPFVGVVSAEQFLERVAERTGLDQGGARRATEAVLETLAERIAGGEVEDLIARLPVPFHEPLKRGLARTGENATRMSLDEFVERVAEREGVDAITAREHARAVMTTLREAVGDEEFLDVIVELPREYRTALVSS